MFSFFLNIKGGTIDITVHEVLRNRNLKELHKASGGAWGGTKVDEAFKAFLSEIIGQKGVEKFKKDCKEDYIDLFRDFETKKRDIAPRKTEKITLKIPITLVEKANETSGRTMEECIASSMYREKLVLFKDKIRIEADVMKGFFDIPLRSILNHVQTLLAEPKVKDCSAIVMVGGFSESPMLQEHIQDHIPDMKIIIPDEAGLAVLKGAVIFGHNPTTIAERVCKFTYGEKMSHLTTNDCTHPKLHTEIDDNGEMRCFDNFRIHVKIGQSVKLGEEQEELLSSPIYDTQTAIDKQIYISTNPNPVFVTDQGCSKIGSFSVPIPDTSLGKLREFGTTFLFGGTEIEVKVVDKATDEVTTKSVDFLGGI
ncbi:heat shock 70 kDa protein 12A-like [Ruditapes philippinarum]|uniref:heat shock 70 kDa protein 12A-like n=1 Tax=Ruditapes philippinarum TaxID=129788 RepID=UPI00295B6B4C|nr:heat shock 70 kDa protein 12A-like [Ruditapes philippinarum]